MAISLGGPSWSKCVCVPVYVLSKMGNVLSHVLCGGWCCDCEPGGALNRVNLKGQLYPSSCLTLFISFLSLQPLSRKTVFLHPQEG